MIREQDVPICPQCKSNGRVKAMRKGADPAEPLDWFCDRCVARLSALPALPATGRVSEAGPKRRKGASDG